MGGKTYPAPFTRDAPGARVARMIWKISSPPASEEKHHRRSGIASASATF